MSYFEEDDYYEACRRDEEERRRQEEEAWQFNYSQVDQWRNHGQNGCLYNPYSGGWSEEDDRNNGW